MTIGEQKLFLADLALRGGVATSHVLGDPYSTAVAEGRRQLALEVIKISNENPATLQRGTRRMLELSVENGLPNDSNPSVNQSLEAGSSPPAGDPWYSLIEGLDAEPQADSRQEVRQHLDSPEVGHAC